ncbi:MAG: Gliding motility lipoprotein GldH [Parabacteroides sp.]
MLKRFLVISIAILLSSCENKALYDQYQIIDKTSWEDDKVYYFTFRVEDTSTPYNLTLQIRNNNLYPYKNLWLFCNEELPIGPLKRDTIECILANEAGKWRGHGISLFQSGFPIRTNYLFPYPGQYTFSFRQAMREKTIKGIQEIGFRVEKANAHDVKHPTGEK